MKILVNELDIDVEQVEETEFNVFLVGYNDNEPENIELNEWPEVSNRYTDDLEILNDYGEVMFVSTNMSQAEKAANIFVYKEGL